MITHGLLWLSAALLSSQDQLLDAHFVAPSNPLVFRRFVGDWERRSTALLVYEPTWRDSLAKIVNSVATEGETVILVSREHETEAVAWFRGLGPASRRARLVMIDTDSPWVRDFGPLLAETSHGQMIWLDAHYRPERPLDDAIPTRLSPMFHAPVEPLTVPLDGGGIIGDGHGLCVMTSSSWVDTGVWVDGQEAVDRLLHQLGCASMAIVPGLVHDPTQHIDMYAQFVAPGVAIVGDVDPADSPEDHRRVEVAVARMRSAARALGRDLKVFRVPLPIFDERHYRTYINGLRFNRVFLAPAYADVEEHTEAAAHAALRRAMPGVDIVSVPAFEMIYSDGAVHCIALAVHESARRSWGQRGPRTWGLQTLLFDGDRAGSEPWGRGRALLSAVLRGFLFDRAVTP